MDLNLSYSAKYNPINWDDEFEVPEFPDPIPIYPKYDAHKIWFNHDSLKSNSMGRGARVILILYRLRSPHEPRS